MQTVDEDTPLEDIVEVMERRHIKRVPVMCGGLVVGIVTRSNLMHAMVSLARAAQPAPATTPPSASGCWRRCRRAVGAGGHVDVVVHDGVVELWGMIIDERQRPALKVAAENIPGVKAVKDHLVWIEPNSGLAIEPKETARTH